MSEVGIPRDKLHVVIEAGLGDQRVGQTGAPSVRQQPRAQETGALPVPVQDFEKGEPKHNIPDITRQAGIAEQFGEDDRRQDGLPMLQRKPGRVDVGARRTRQVGNERTGVDGDQRRSSRSFLRSSENETLPRSARNFS